MQLQQLGPTGILNQVGAATQYFGDGVQLDYQQNEHCTGNSGVAIFDDTAALEFQMDLPVVGGTPVQVCVTVTVNLWGDNGSADLDFLTSPRNINVLGVALILYWYGFQSHFL
jgi:hypothetical protein